MDTVHIPEGWFWMGSEGHFAWESPRHRVWVNEFEMARTTVTRRQYATFLSATVQARPIGWDEPALSMDDDAPVVGISWFDAVRYCEWMSTQCDKICRLPSEAEWEKACRGGLDDADYAWGNEPPSSIDYFGGLWDAPKVPGQWRSNGYGLLNIGDNVHEWCTDWYSENYYAESPDTNPQGPKNGTRRVSRGGSWRHQIKASRAAHRSSLPPHYRYTDYGFRTVFPR